MMNEQEIEAKFYLRDLAGLEKKLLSLGADCIQARVHEVNLRFDTPKGELTSARQVLRLRQDTQAHLTFKGPAQEGQEVSVRQEIEFEVSNFEAARHFLEALGYHVSVMYEKFRTTYEVSGVRVVLDELPYGTFAEIEGPDAGSIQIVAAALRLNWDARCVESYLGLFMRLRESRGISAEHLSFDALQGMVFFPQDFGILYAD
jgi:adenylate cyclase class 2